MLTMKNFIDVKKDVISSGEEIFSLEKNWKIFKPYLNKLVVKESLKKGLEFNNVKVETSVKATMRWYLEIQNKIEADAEFLFAKQSLHKSMYGVEAKTDEDWYSDPFTTSKAYSKLESKFEKKYQPRKGSFEWYQWKRASFPITPFVATLLKTAITDAEAFLIINSKTHSVAAFIKDNILYFADLLVEWDSVNDLKEFMGEVTQITILNRH
ncbi:hypothetical protein [Paenibacillus sp. FSL H7-0331]|uniref:hypothetical protein n=1 Tax=Paenibacillus sp. FSL H7-0331 TaxID=1920421 RepID=UPI00096BF80B|nr:hypothetical protein [Paenibacillus sp. FSL H7-0331]OMF04880.1 hypothetical protein BK127_32990 [Paenibacillus sp. FSL H7-0331]